jgi:hypothetical protein
LLPRQAASNNFHRNATLINLGAMNFVESLDVRPEGLDGTFFQSKHYSLGSLSENFVERFFCCCCRFEMKTRAQAAPSFGGWAIPI